MAGPLGEALPLNGWENFYVIVGSSAAALTGLTFIVITISAEANIANTPAARLSGLRAFITPIAVHFCAALLVSLLLSTPRLTATSLAVCLGVLGVAGIGYCARVVYWMLKLFVNYKPFASDWIWNAILPPLGYLGLLIDAALLPRHPPAGLYLVAAMTVLLLFIGIHNAWDVVAWVTTERHARKYHSRRANAESGDSAQNDSAR